jgi:hypothetical protein
MLLLLIIGDGHARLFGWGDLLRYCALAGL